ncbi:MAG: hypothetical protein U5L95_01765 [Candidatus Saccharibacteria bacterium]|nr:hypothetical protein [Candidatus Saccharibacteria bacterium]
MPYKISKTKLLLAVFLCFVLLFLATVLPVRAVTQSYQTDDSALLPGMVVSLGDDSDARNPLIRRAGVSNARKLVGISTAIEDNLVSLSRANRPVFVVTDGEVDAYVVDTKGEIENGDALQLSSIRGVLEKNQENTSGIIVATALEDSNFDTTDTYQATGSNESQEVKAMKIRVAINNQAFTSSGELNDKQSGLAELGFAITGRDIGEIRVVIALVIFLLVMVAEGGIIYGAVSSAITSLGRNPLAKKFIRRELVRVLFVAFLVLVVGIFAIHAILFV